MLRGRPAAGMVEVEEKEMKHTAAWLRLGRVPCRKAVKQSAHVAVCAGRAAMAAC